MRQPTERRLIFKPVDLIPLTGIITMSNRNTVPLTTYHLETYRDRVNFAAYQLLSTTAVVVSGAGLYVLAEKF